MKKYYVLITLVLAFTLLAACSSNDVTDGYNNQNEPAIEVDDEYTNGSEIVVVEPVILEPSSEIIEIQSFDGYTLRGRLTLPGEETIDKLVIFVNSSGSMACSHRRKKAH
jgi:hypothetical protein